MDIKDIAKQFDIKGEVLDVKPLGNGLINGDTYYKIKYPGHNLVRTRNQMALFRSTLKHYDEMVEYIRSL